MQHPQHVLPLVMYVCLRVYALLTSYIEFFLLHHVHVFCVVFFFFVYLETKSLSVSHLIFDCLRYPLILFNPWSWSL